jgi:branched-chain amino acid transport system permease protein
MPDALTVAARANHVLVGVLILAGLAFAAIGAAQNDTFYLRLATEALIFGGLALSVDILLGYTGLLSLGQALYFGLGAYLSALVLKAVPSFWLALAAGLGAGLVLGLVGGIIAIRVRGVYFALITFGLAQVVAKVVYNTRALGASDGLLGVPIIDIDLGVVSVSSASPAGFFLVVLAVIMGLYAVSAYILDTPFGRLLIALRANDRRVPFLGYRTASLRLSSFVFAAVIATVSGTLYPMLRGFVSPELLFFSTSGNAVITVLLGGVGTLMGALYGSVLLTVLRSVLGTWTEHHLMIIGLLFMGAVIFLPRGLMGLVRPAVERLLVRKAPP